MREIAVTHAFRIPAGAQLHSGPRDGLVVREALIIDTFERGGRPVVVLLFADGSEQRLDASEQVAWLHPAGRTANR